MVNGETMPPHEAVERHYVHAAKDDIGVHQDRTELRGHRRQDGPRQHSWPIDQGGADATRGRVLGVRPGSALFQVEFGSAFDIETNVSGHDVVFLSEVGQSMG